MKNSGEVAMIKLFNVLKLETVILSIFSANSFGS
jgi:hypothetical protein